ncbi:MAG TPA: hypothetical protein PKA80_02410 [Ignavibacteriaceae bacterium]|nr:hypothetical protein [Ignavibacteriaceae bacterium]
MKNIVTCKICKKENPFYNLRCDECKGFLRDKVPNIDFWSAVLNLIDSPSVAFKTIVFSEHKNFVFPLTFFFTSKMILLMLFISSFALHNSEAAINHFLIFTLIVFISVIATLYFFSWAIKYILYKYRVETRTKDNFSILVYSLVGYVFSLIILLPIELILFGSTLIQNSPSPFLLKPIPAYAMLIFESLFILWSFWLMNRGFYVQSKSLIFGLAVSVLFYLIVFSLPIIVIISIQNSIK